MRKGSWAAVFVTMICVLSSRVFAQQATPATATSTSTTPTIDQSLEMKGAFSPEISPDGKRVVYEVSRTNWEDNAFERDLWIVDTTTGEGHQLTASKKSSTNRRGRRTANGLRFSPTGRGRFQARRRVRSRFT